MSSKWDCLFCGTETYQSQCPKCGKTKAESESELDFERSLIEGDKKDDEEYRTSTGRYAPKETKTPINDWPDNPCTCTIKTCTMKERYFNGCTTGRNKAVGGV